MPLGGHLVAQIPLAALAGVTAWVWARLPDRSTWRRLPKMRRVDAAAFVVTALAVLSVYAVAAVATGCSLYILRHVHRRIFVPSQDDGTQGHEHEGGVDPSATRAEESQLR